MSRVRGWDRIHRDHRHRKKTDDWVRLGSLAGTAFSHSRCGPDVRSTFEWFVFFFVFFFISICIYLCFCSRRRVLTAAAAAGQTKIKPRASGTSRRRIIHLVRTVLFVYYLFICFFSFLDAKIVCKRRPIYFS